MKRGIQAVPPSQAFQQARVNLPGVVEAIWQPLYDRQVKTAAATTVQTFFQVPLGSGTTAVGTGAKTLSDTNMLLNGNIPKGQAFQITGVEVDFMPDLDITNDAEDSQYANDVLDFYKGGNLTLTVGSKPYIQQGNLMQFAPQHRLAGFAAVATTNGTTASEITYAQAAGREFSVVPILLESSQNFSVSLGDLAATSTTGLIFVRLNGYLYRNAQ